MEYVKTAGRDGEVSDRKIRLSAAPHGKLIGMQYFHEIAKSFAWPRRLNNSSTGSAKFRRLLRVLFEAQDDVATSAASEGALRSGSRVGADGDVGDYHPACANVLKACSRVWRPAAAATFLCTSSRAGGKAPFVWSIG